MNVIERVSIKLRHSPALAEAAWLWNLVRPVYDKSIAVIGRKGLERKINGTDRMLILPKFRNVTEVYEPETWALLRAEVNPGDSVADVGSYIGLYTIALAQLVGRSGRVYAFEPNSANCVEIREHLKLNQIEDRVELVQAALGDNDGDVPFDGSRGIQGHVSTASTNQTPFVACLRLDTFLAGRAVDVLKIDVEGYEEFVLRGASELLSSPERKPRSMFIEVHPYAWPELGTSSNSLLKLLADFGYQTQTLEGEPVEKIERYGEIIARR
jgi:FkbM family methyltransferase